MLTERTLLLVFGIYTWASFSGLDDLSLGAAALCPVVVVVVVVIVVVVVRVKNKTKSSRKNSW